MVNQPIQMRLGPVTESKLRGLAEHYRWTPGQTVAELIGFYERLTKWCGEFHCGRMGGNPEIFVDVEKVGGVADVRELGEANAFKAFYGLLCEIKRGPLSAFRSPTWPDSIPEHHTLGDFVVPEESEGDE